MRGSLKLLVLGLLAVAGVATGVFASGGGAAPVHKSGAAKSSAITKITVNASEFKYKFSKLSAPTGTVIFTVVNKGKITHDFKINGKKTPRLSPGKSAKLTVNFTKKGRTLPLHAPRSRRRRHAGPFAVATSR